MARLTASPFAAPALAALALAGCTVGPDYRAKTPAELGVPTAYSVPAPASPEDLTRWWSNFDDPVLGQLVEQARGANTDIAQAIGRLRQAREALVHHVLLCILSSDLSCRTVETRLSQARSD